MSWRSLLDLRQMAHTTGFSGCARRVLMRLYDKIMERQVRGSYNSSAGLLLIDSIGRRWSQVICAPKHVSQLNLLNFGKKTVARSIGVSALRSTAPPVN